MHAEDFKLVVTKARRIFKAIKEKYIGLSGHLIFSSAFGQCELTSDMMKILQSYPDMILNSKYKEQALELIREMAAMQKNKKNGLAHVNSKTCEHWEEVMTELEKLFYRLEVKDDVFIEVRLRKADLELISKLKKEDLISQVHTPQEKSSIRIVFGTLEEIYRNRK
jgi:hypothetical protein